LCGCAGSTTEATSFVVTTSTPTDTLIPTDTPTLTNTLTPTETPNLYTSFSPFEKSSWSAESQAYISSLPNRQIAEPGSALEQQYIQEDKKFNDYYLRGMVSYLEKQGIEVDVSDFENYDEAIKVYEALWKYQAQHPENYNTEYVPTPWIIRQMRENPDNIIFSMTFEDGHRGYGIGANEENNYKTLLEYFKVSTIQELYEKLRERRPDVGFNVPIFGVDTHSVRKTAAGSTYGVLTAIADHPAYSDGSVKILIIGFLDENNKWVYQPFSVNLGDNKTKPGDYIYSNQHISPAPEGYEIPVVGSNFPGLPHREEYSLNDLIGMIGHEIYGEPNNGFVDSNHPNPLLLSQYLLSGVETFGVIEAGIEAPTSPLSQ